MRYKCIILQRWFTIAFSPVPFHLFVMISALCSNHVTYHFGKGMTPNAHQLDLSSVAVIMDNYAKYVILSSAVDTFLIQANPPIVNLQSNTAATSCLKFLPGQGPACNWMCSPMPVTTIGTEKGELLVLLPYGRFFSIPCLDHGARCEFLFPVLWGKHPARCFHHLPPILSNTFLFPWDYHWLPCDHRHSSSSEHITPTLFLSCLCIMSLAQHLHS